MFAGIKNVHIFSMDNTPSYIYFFSVAAVVSLYSTCVTFSYQYQNDIGNEIVLRTTAEVTYEHFWKSVFRYFCCKLMWPIRFACKVIFRFDIKAKTEIFHGFVYETHLQFMSPL